jgi:hypothetical protein
VAVLAVLGVFTCQSSDPSSSCPTPVPSSKEASLLTEARGQARFALVYPCYLPNVQNLSSASVLGTTGRQQAEMVFSGTFDLTLRQGQIAPAVSADPAGASRRTIDLYPNVQATFIEQNDGTSKALYHLFWQQDGVFYEVQAYGPPLQSQTIVKVARSLQ